MISIKKDKWAIKKEIKKGKFVIDLDSLKAKELEILQNFINACKKMNLKYYVAYGTLIGAVRHNGFIPWDDDIDVCLPRKDYDYFINNYINYMTENYFVQTIQSDPLYALNFAKLRDSNTTLIEKHVIDVDINHGVFIDIFPLDGYVKGQNKILDLRVKNIPVFEERDTNLISNTINGINKKIAYKIGETLPNKLKTDLSKLAVPIDTPAYEDCDYVACLVDSLSIIPFEKSLLGEGKKIKFENLTVNIPDRYDEYLRTFYGDYMKLPPEEQRVSHHNFHFVDIDKSFREYEEKIK